MSLRHEASRRLARFSILEFQCFSGGVGPHHVGSGGAISISLGVFLFSVHSVGFFQLYILSVYRRFIGHWTIFLWGVYLISSHIYLEYIIIRNNLHFRPNFLRFVPFGFDLFTEKGKSSSQGLGGKRRVVA